MSLEPLTARSVPFPPGHVAVRLTPQHRRAYRELYARTPNWSDGLPALRDRDFDGRPVRMSRRRFEALSRAFAHLAAAEEPAANVFERQEAGRTELFKRLQYLS